MNSKTGGTNLLGWVIGMLIALTTLVVMFPPNMSFLKKGSEYAVFIMLGFLFLGMLFMMLDKKKLMTLSLSCVAILCLFLKNSSNANLIFPARNNSPIISVAHINLSYINQGYDELIEILEELDPEIISFQEMTPDWNIALKQKLSKNYVSKYSLVRMDTYGMAIYSKKVFTKVDTFMYQDIPNIKSEINLEGEALHLCSSYLLPPLNKSSRDNMINHLEVISNKVREIDEPIFALGDYNLVPWSPEIRDFREKTNLGLSRRNIDVSRFQKPYDHIMYSQHLECIDFKELEDEALNHIGIYGKYQLKANGYQLARRK